jgi:catechol 2,3-dioxygenase-like lactoylglutathione lyase family enzyme
MNLNQVTLTVINMDVSTEFYRRLGFLQIVDTPHYARFACPDGAATFSLSLAETDVLTNAKNKLSTGTTVYFEHEKLDEWVETLQSRGIEFDQLPSSQSYLWREAILTDPSGNKIKLYWAGENRLNPPWRVEKTYQALNN